MPDYVDPSEIVSVHYADPSEIVSIQAPSSGEQTSPVEHTPGSALRNPDNWRDLASSGLRGLGNTADFLQAVAGYANPFTVGEQAIGLKQKPSAGLERLAQAISGDPNVMKYGEETPLGAVGEMIPSVLQPGVAPARAALSGGAAMLGAGVGRKLGGAPGELIGSLAPTAIEAIARRLAPVLLDRGSEMARGAIGARSSDYGKTANRLGILDDAASEDKVQTITRKTLDDLIDSGALGASRDPAKMEKVARQTEESLEKQVGALVQQFDQTTAAPVKPTFDRAKEMLTSGAIPGNKIKSYAKRLADIETAIEQGGNRLPFVQRQKIAIGRDWSPDDNIQNMFTRAIYADLQKTIEDVIPGVRPLNQELQKWKIVGPILERGLATKEGSDSMKKLVAFLRTSGGFGVPMIMGAKLGHPVLGVAAGVAANTMQSPRGRAEVAKVLKASAPLAEGIGSLSESYAPLVAALAGTGSR